MFIEICQLFLTRGTDVDDLILNTLGVVFGLLCYKLLYKKFNNKMDEISSFFSNLAILVGDEKNCCFYDKIICRVSKLVVEKCN